MQTYRLLISLAFIMVMAAPGLSDEWRTIVAVAFATGLVTAWQSERDAVAGKLVSKSKPFVLAGTIFFFAGTFAFITLALMHD